MSSADYTPASDPALTVVTGRQRKAIPLVLLNARELGQWRTEHSATTRALLRSAQFTAKPGSYCILPDRHGHPDEVLVGVGKPLDPFSLAGLPAVLPAGAYRLGRPVPAAALTRLAVGWGLAGYEFTAYQAHPKPRAASRRPRLVVDDRAAATAARARISGITLTRDLINTPAGDMMPEHLAAAAARLAEQFGGRFTQHVGADLARKGFPAIHAVGRASAHPPRLLDLQWGEPDAPGITLVGKGVCFDSGGLDLKAASGMRLMKKDMGGAAHALGLGRMIMDTVLPIRLRVLIPAVENAVSGCAYRPGDVIPTRAGINIEIGNTDAEGRVVLSDALTRAGEDDPELIVDFATLTGAARVALGTELPALFTNDDALAARLMSLGSEESDPVWRLPLYEPYRELIESRVADLSNAGSSPLGGAITAALFLQRFVPAKTSWAHLDLMAWNPRSRPGRPEGAEAMSLRTVLGYLERRFREG